ncbi:MAG TPA: M56 family metallopeptidase [Pedobacter sp.]|nr:M56 family metallopeptidase [Pedobacter sp.]
MPDLLLILFKINLVLLLFALAYYLVLRRLTFYTLNRAFLAIGIIFSTVYPFINLTEFFTRQEQINPKVVALVPTIDVNALIRSNEILYYWQIVVILFYVGAAFMAIRLIAQFVSLYRVHQRSKPGEVSNLKVRILEGRVSPFSFWQTVYVNPTIHSPNELDTILAHEQVHVKEWHTLDIMLAEISVVFYWFNPGVWLMKRAIKENIEFITDARIVKKGINKKAYQYSLLGVGNLQASVAIVNNFNLSDLKKRIKMMNAKRSSPKKLIIYAFMLPALLITTLAFTVNKKRVNKHLVPLTKALSKANIFKDDVKIDVVTLKAIAKVERKRTPLRLKIVQEDTVNTIRYLIRSVALTNDSVNEVRDVPAAVLVARNVHFETALKGVVKGVRLSDGVAVYNDSDSTRKNVTVGKVENINIVLRKPGVPLPVSDGTRYNEIVVTGYAKKLVKPNDSVKNFPSRSIYLINGRSISEEELHKIRPNEIKSVIIKSELPGKKVLLDKKD